MTLSQSRYSYEDCFELLDRALDNETGCRAAVPDSGAAYHLIMRLHYARQLSRNENSQAYPPEHPEHGKSAYDSLIVSKRFEEGQWWVYITHRKAPLVVEDLA